MEVICSTFNYLAVLVQWPQDQLLKVFFLVAPTSLTYLLIEHVDGQNSCTTLKPWYFQGKSNHSSVSERWCLRGFRPSTVLVNTSLLIGLFFLVWREGNTPSQKRAQHHMAKLEAACTRWGASICTQQLFWDRLTSVSSKAQHWRPGRPWPDPPAPCRGTEGAGGGGFETATWVHQETQKPSKNIIPPKKALLFLEARGFQIE